jgi:SAM-dependent methyltransferase
VLQRRADIDAARRELADRKLLPPRPSSAARAIGRIRTTLGHPDPALDLYPDAIKSWDVLRAIEAVCSSVGREEAVLDVGSVASAVLPCLRAIGYRRLAGIDLDERVRSMFFSTEIQYAVEDLTRTTRPDSSLAAITAISVIEHGVDEKALLAEIARLLRPGGIFVFSTDYWPQKVDTDGVLLFDRPWRIFSAKEIEALLDSAAAYGLSPRSDPRSHIREANERAVRFHDRSYTFLYGVLVRG